MRLIKGTKKFINEDADKIIVKLFEFEDFEPDGFWYGEKNGINEDEVEDGAVIRRPPGYPEDIEIETEQLKHQAELSGKEEGYKIGYDEGRKEAIEQFRREFNLINQIKENLNEYKKEIIKNIEPDFLSLAQYMAEKIIRKKINVDPGLVLSTVEFAVKQISQLGKVIIYLNPEDYEYLKLNKQEIDEIINNFEEIKILEDKRIEKGGCVIETENGNIDAQPSSQLKIMNRVLADSINS